jgi:outer membrane protein TolC
MPLRVQGAAPLLLAIGLGGCVLAPAGTADEQAKVQAASAPFEKPIEARELPVLPSPTQWQDVLTRAFLANGDLEAAYFQWKAAVVAIDRAATWPNSNVSVSFSYLLGPGGMKAWNRTTIGGGFDPSVPLVLPIKTQAAGKVALDAAREAAERFRAAKFELQRQVLTAYLDLALTEEQIRIERDNLSILKLLIQSASARAQTGGPLQDLLKTQIDAQLSQNKLANLEADAASKRSALNAFLARDANAPLALPATLPEPRAVLADDARLISVAVVQNPDLAALARQVEGRKDALEVARLAYIPDIIPSASITGSISQLLGAMVMLPTTRPAIRAAVDEAAAMQRQAEATAQQAQHDRSSSFVANLYIMRNAERQTTFYQKSVMPAAEQLLRTSREEYAAGNLPFADLIDSERTYISVREMLAEVRIEREKRLAELEVLAGVDIETLGEMPSGTSPGQ